MKFKIGNEVVARKGFEVTLENDLDVCDACKNPRFFINDINDTEETVEIKICGENFDSDNVPCVCHEWTEQAYVELEDDGSF